MRGRSVESPPESMRLFSMCERMKWSHLPVAGGIYDQHPRLLEEWAVIFAHRDKVEEENRRADEAKQKRNMGRPRRR